MNKLYGFILMAFCSQPFLAMADDVVPPAPSAQQTVSTDAASTQPPAPVPAAPDTATHTEPLPPPSEDIIVQQPPAPESTPAAPQNPPASTSSAAAVTAVAPPVEDTKPVTALTQQVADLRASLSQLQPLQSQVDLLKQQITTLQYAVYGLSGLVVLVALLSLVRPRKKAKVKHEEPGEYDFMNTSEAIPAKLDLARAYIAMEDFTAARETLAKILNEGNEDHRREAKSLLNKIRS